MRAATRGVGIRSGKLFDNLGTTLVLVRQLRRKSQGAVAREAGIGKSQLSKYETGKELPKLDSLARVLGALGIGHFEFFYTLHFIDQRVLAPGAGVGPGPAERAAGGPDARLFALAMPAHHPALSESTDAAFSQLLADLLTLYRQVLEQLLAGGSAPR